MDIPLVLKTYSELMTEIKERLAVMNGILNDQKGLPDWAAIEFMQLQIRMICELLALACLVAHGDVKGTRSGRLPKAYEADFILNTLEKLHPYFYPRPSRQIHEGGRKFHL
jgi:hypothetical protein